MVKNHNKTSQDNNHLHNKHVHLVTPTNYIIFAYQKTKAYRYKKLPRDVFFSKFKLDYKYIVKRKKISIFGYTKVLISVKGKFKLEKVNIFYGLTKIFLNLFNDCDIWFYFEIIWKAWMVFFLTLLSFNGFLLLLFSFFLKLHRFINIPNSIKPDITLKEATRA